MPTLDFTHGWTNDPWWLRDGYRGLLPADLDAEPATGQLALLYDDVTCRSLILRRGGGSLIAILHPAVAGMGGPTLSGPLRLGEDLAQCSSWTDCASLVGALRNPEGHADARVEVGVWAGLTRQGLAVAHEPDEQAGNAGKVADFFFEEAGLRYALELKVVATSDIDERCRIIEGWLVNVAIRAAPPEANEICRLHLDDAFANRLHAMQIDALDALLADRTPEVVGWYASEVRRLADLVLPGLGRLQFERRGASPRCLDTQIVGRDRTSASKHLDRILRKARDGSSQLRPARRVDRRVVAVWVSTYAFDVTAVTHAMVPVMRDKSQGLGIDCVVIFNHRQHSRRNTDGAVLVVPVADGAPIDLRAKWLLGLRDWKMW